MNLNFTKNSDGLLPAIIQDSRTGIVLMLGYMNQESFDLTKDSGIVVFFSRSRNKIWEKGETSGNFLNVKEILIDCDEDTILIKAEPVGPVCHTGSSTCFDEQNISSNFLSKLEQKIIERKNTTNEHSYTSQLFDRGINKIAQKVGEEAVELVIEACGEDIQSFKEEAADLFYHTMVLLAAKEISLDDVVKVLEQRSKN